MDEVEKHRYRTASLQYCNKLMNEVQSDRDEIERFFGGEIFKTYVTVTDEVLNKIAKIRTRIKSQ